MKIERHLKQKLAVVIVTHNAGDIMLQALRGLWANYGTDMPEVVVVDNGSSDGSVEAAENEFASLRCLRLGRNSGFGAANNYGAVSTTQPFVLFLNPDTEVLPHAFERMLGYLETHSTVGVVGARLLNSDGSLQLSCRSFPRLTTALANRHSLLTKLFPNNPWSRQYLSPQIDVVRGGKVDWVSGACLMVRREAGNLVGWFDDGYFLFCEDTDLCRRLELAGWETHYVPSAEVVHHIGISHNPTSLQVIIARHMSMWRYYKKFMRRKWLDPVVVVGIVGRAGLSVIVRVYRRVVEELRKLWRTRLFGD